MGIMHGARLKPTLPLHRSPGLAAAAEEKKRKAILYLANTAMDVEAWRGLIGEKSGTKGLVNGHTSKTVQGSQCS